MKFLKSVLSDLNLQKRVFLRKRSNIFPRGSGLLQNWKVTHTKRHLRRAIHGRDTFLGHSVQSERMLSGLSSAAVGLDGDCKKNQWVVHSTGKTQINQSNPIVRHAHRTTHLFWNLEEKDMGSFWGSKIVISCKGTFLSFASFLQKILV